MVNDEIAEKLKAREYERVGGVIRRSNNKRIVVWLRQNGEIPTPTGITNTVFRIIAHSTDLRNLSDDELIEFGRYINEHPVLSGFNFYSGTRTAVKSIVDKYDRLVIRNKKEAMIYVKDKRNSLVNIFSRTYIPNLKHQVELGMINVVYDETKNVVDFIKQN